MPDTKDTKQITPKQAQALLLAGQLAGVAFDLNADALEEFCDNLPEDTDFRYEPMCRAAIEFTRKMSEAVYAKPKTKA